ncbi:carbonic anhydrase [Jatrophihabitans endophyticus]|uniref:beta-class carbonic anhydrase n=1 Tax=Jatrophihabitans endophyticus TaxID=1206085 RepID=UPI0019EC4895|nr:carbonic anhydrase [Jatrophihabitans endophyticus]MBE7187886.1 carbonic anhydrase [Jatrophihabitans endophyticus]
MSATDRLVSANQQYEMPPSHTGSARPSLQTTIITCMDSRLDLFGTLGLEIGEAHLIRNAGGMITDDVLRSLAISQRVLGTREVVVIHHTSCGMHGFDDDAFRAELEGETGEAPGWRVPGFDDVRDGTREAVQQVRDCGWVLHRDAVRGFVYDVADGHLTEVD